MQHHLIRLQQQKLLRSIRSWLVFFIVALVLSGLTALGIETQMQLLSGYFPARHTIVGGWLWQVFDAVKDTNQRYPFIAYGFDWLAFAHLVIAIVFIGPLQDPVRNIWVIQFGRVACCAVLPFACIAGHSRGLPIWWCGIDCCFGIAGFIPLNVCLKRIRQLEILQQTSISGLFHSSTLKNENVYENL